MSLVGLTNLMCTGKDFKRVAGEDIYCIFENSPLIQRGQKKSQLALF